MAHLLLNLYQATDDEAEDVRKLLDQYGIEWYETRPSFWGVSHGGIWVRHDADIARARRVFHAYQVERSDRVRAQWDAARAAGTAPTLWSSFRSNPSSFIGALLVALLMLGLVVLPVWLLF